ncbi:MAG: sigma-54 dependent transcriptional regulator [Ignavibacterium sp.]|jgi:DNA-binding NtrC family response regulator|nr:sigma-54-dependent Fis family transcriptional regulator [Ignavibacterium sp.]MDX9712111.1 sigma-54 dependent transcriptional regulator [Ignavibacteriaceae bacterium]MEB2353950.1 sigma-54 dependent transcriptional regulator [Ignavibacteriales bacterium]GIK22170.1 MAG: sigma-54-dependent Fis family transcriptional regulator [Ignavibacteriota bacterium]MDD5608791.1 sigma-54 dependent transcriptional regulator [Ignavibacterium sp.]
MKSVLIIDDELQICESIKMILEYEGYDVEFTTSANEGLEIFSSKDFAAVFLDIQMPELNGFEVLKKIKEQKQSASVIIISAHGSVENAIKATRLGAFDFLEKPIDRDKLLISVRNATESASLKEEYEEIKKVWVGDGEILGKSKAIRNILEMIDKVAPLDTRVLITGENGTGKELVARAIHNNSERKDKSFVEVNCAAIPNELIESELFGHEKGSFTGAVQQRIGRFELANKGTLFLDEVGDMSLQAQAKVLRAIEDGKIERVGGGKKIDVDVRLIAATNKNLKDEISKGTFREDLFHRLNVIPINVPPLRERLEDIPILVNHFANDISLKHKKPLTKFSDDAIQVLKNQTWTGNVRELRNIIERIIIIVDKREISHKDIDFMFASNQHSVDDLVDTSNSFQEFKEKAERVFILKQLIANDWNISKTAEMLDIQRSHLYNKMKKYGIEKEE